MMMMEELKGRERVGVSSNCRAMRRRARKEREESLFAFTW